MQPRKNCPNRTPGFNSASAKCFRAAAQRAAQNPRRLAIPWKFHFLQAKTKGERRFPNAETCKFAARIFKIVEKTAIFFVQNNTKFYGLKINGSSGQERFSTHFVLQRVIKSPRAF